MGGVESLGRFFFKRRAYLGIPYFLVALFYAKYHPYFFILGLLLIIIGETIRILSLRYSGPTTRSRELVAPELVVEGPYSYSRNPLYFGNFFIGLGFSILSGALFPYLQIAFVPLFFVEYYPIILAEEKFLEERFGEAYLNYKRSVPRFIPKVKGTSGHPKYSVWEVLSWERSTLYLIIGLFIVFSVIFLLKS